MTGAHGPSGLPSPRGWQTALGSPAGGGPASGRYWRGGAAGISSGSGATFSA